MIREVLATAVTFLLVACTRPTAPARDASADRAAVNAAMDAYIAAIRSGDTTVITRFWVEDAVYMAPTTPTVHGRAALDSLHRSVVRTARVTDVSVRTEETVVDQELAFQTATYSETLQPAHGAPNVIRGRLLFVWRRQADGTWRIARAMGTDATGT